MEALPEMPVLTVMGDREAAHLMNQLHRGVGALRHLQVVQTVEPELRVNSRGIPEVAVVAAPGLTVGANQHLVQLVPEVQEAVVRGGLAVDHLIARIPVAVVLLFSLALVGLMLLVIEPEEEVSATQPAEDQAPEATSQKTHCGCTETEGHT